MQKSIKAALLSAFVYPGLGHLSLNHKRRGAIIIVLVTTCLVVLVREAVNQAQAAVAQIQSQGNTIDIAAITAAANQAAANADSTLSNIAFFIIVILWGYSIVDAFLLGKKLEQ